MATYAVFEPPLKDQSAGAADVLAHAERFKFVRDGFSWLAFLFTPFWMLFNRLWLAFVCYVVAMALVGVGAMFFGLVPGAVTLASLVIALLVGFEAATLRRRKLLRRRWQDRGIVIADGRDAAEQRFFDRWVAETRMAVAAEPLRARSDDTPSGLAGAVSPKDTSGDNP